MLRGVAASVRVAVLPSEFKDSDGDDVRDVLLRPDGRQLVEQAIADAKMVEKANDPDEAGDTVSATIELPEGDPLALTVSPTCGKPQRMANANKWKLIGDISATGALDFVGELREAGKSAQTYNHYLKSAKQFTRWSVRDRRAPTDPLAHLSKLNVSTDRRHDHQGTLTVGWSLSVLTN